VNVVETGWLKRWLSTDFGDFQAGIVEKSGTTWGQIRGKLCTAGDTGVDNFSPVITDPGREGALVRPEGAGVGS
jgi:hypothetical protein